MRTTGSPKLASRLRLYLVMFALALLVALELARAGVGNHLPGKSVGWLFLGDLAILAIIISLNELSIWRKRRAERPERG